MYLALYMRSRKLRLGAVGSPATSLKSRQKGVGRPGRLACRGSHGAALLGLHVVHVAALVRDQALQEQARDVAVAIAVCAHGVLPRAVADMVALGSVTPH